MIRVCPAKIAENRANTRLLLKVGSSGCAEDGVHAEKEEGESSSDCRLRSTTLDPLDLDTT